MKVEINITDDTGNVKKYSVDASLHQIIWDAFLTAEYQDEHWHDQDTCNLIVEKLKGESPIEYVFNSGGC